MVTDPGDRDDLPAASPPADNPSAGRSPAADGLPAAELEAPLVAELVVAESVPAPKSVARLPHPNWILAILWCLALLMVQLTVGVAVGIGLMIVHFVRGATAPPAQAAFNDQFMTLLVPLGTATTVLVAVAICVLFYGRQTGRRIAWRGMTALQYVAVLLCVLPLAVLASEVTNWAAYVLPELQLSELMEFGESFWLIVFVGGCLFPGVGEEIFFRGFLGRGLLARYGAVFGTLWTALLFGLIHIEPIQACGAFVLGVAMHFLLLTTRSLLAPIILHTLNNSLAFALYRWNETLPIPGVSTLPAEEEVVHTPLLLLAAAVLALGSLGGLLYQTRTRWRLPDGSLWTPGYVTGESPEASTGAVAESPAPHAGLLLLAVLSSAALVGCILLVQRNYVGG
ncbi:MAG: CPBP family intramembrane metalloprotease [Pirellulaceae bacterium]|nr:CPBP family intramembrane metalloprotease [Pirellulaceae bacterium]